MDSKTVKLISLTLGEW